MPNQKSANPENKPTAVQLVTIDEAYAGQRIDNYLITFLKGVPKSHIYRILRKGEVRVNKGRIKQTYKLKVGDIVRVPPIRVSEAKNVPETLPPALARLKDSIIYEDKDLIVLNKPAGIAVHGGSGINLGVIESLRVLYPLAKRLELVHRLDRATSGCLLIAKKASVLKALHEQIREDKMEKTYVTLLKGQITEKRVKIDEPLRKFVTKSGERMVKVDRDGKPSVTIFFPKQVFNGLAIGATLVDVKLITGRTHQIRVHSLHFDHPVAGDDKYGDDNFNDEMKRVGLNRMFLHARSLRFVHPVTGETMNPVAPMGKRLTLVIEKLTEMNK
ncbi:MAG: 23S rRNA pseudouridine(955/2504/2580) synthase RluC [Gammaproteobacteria bacterium]|nr:23S rRNA pseudouridine(955/2504/2580) synthase RluC [Gammaproteobacteria bacterium]